MALLFMDSFESYGNNLATHINRAMGDGIVSTGSSNALPSTTQKKHGTYSLRSAGHANDFVKATEFNGNIVIFGAYVYFDHAINNNYYFLRGGNAAGSLGWYLGTNNEGRLQLRDSGTTTRVQSNAGLITQGAWYRIEGIIHMASSVTANVCKVYLDGTLVLNDTTGGWNFFTSTDSRRISFYSSVSQVYYDNVYLFDNTGSKNNSPILSPYAVGTLRQNGNGTVSDFVGSDADSVDNYLHVDEAEPDSDTSYVESDVLNAKDLYAYENSASLPATPTAIRGVMVSSVAKKTTDTAVRKIRQLARVNGTTYNGANEHSLSNGAYTSQHQIWEVSPDTSVDWTTSELDAAEFGVEIVA